MTLRPAIRAEAERLLELFRQEGAVPVDPPVLQEAGALLDLYGEDIRARAYITSDALRGEQMLRPDFTVPVVQMHMAHGAEPACYTYAGEVFRRQEDDPERANEYFQAGFEIFDRENAEAADARVFSVIYRILEPLGLRAATGDIGILMAAVEGLRTTEPRKRALMRHIWRPRRFHDLLERYSGVQAVPEGRARLLAEDDPFSGEAPQIGLRSRAEIDARIAALREDAAAEPISGEEVAFLDAVTRVQDSAERALMHLQGIARDMPAIAPAVERLERRLTALDQAGIAPASLEFEGSYGRTQMEYYDGFVFGFYAEGRPDMPPVATGGRYDALTRQLGAGREIPAVGGVIRPGLLVELGGGA